MKFTNYKKLTLKKLIKKVLSENSNDLADLFDADEEREERRYTTNDYGDHGPQSDFGDSFDNMDPENYNEEDGLYEMQGPKSDDDYKSELANYLEDNQIYGYTDKIHNIMTGPDEAFALDRLADYLKEEKIYGYTRAIEGIYADYLYDQHWENQPDEDQIDESKTGDVHMLAQESDTLRDFLIAVKTQYPKVDIRRDIKELQDIWNNRQEDEIDYDDENFSDPFIDGEDDLFEGQKSLSELLK